LLAVVSSADGLYAVTLWMGCHSTSSSAWGQVWPPVPRPCLLQQLPTGGDGVPACSGHRVEDNVLHELRGGEAQTICSRSSWSASRGLCSPRCRCAPMQSASSRALNCVSVEILFHNGELNLLWPGSGRSSGWWRSMRVGLRVCRVY
jgi:hypothetical protein